MIQYGSKLVVGSASEFFDGRAQGEIMQWDGADWSPLSSGIQKADCCPWVHALAVLGSDLIVGGEFEVAGTDSARNIARWDGVDWSPMGSGLAPVNALAVVGNTLYAGTEGGVYAWDGFTWMSLGAFDRPVYAMAPWGSGLAVAGSFSSIGGMPAHDFALWTGMGWIDIGGTGADSHISMSLAVLGADLYAGGWFRKINGVPVKGVGRWDGMGWHAVGTELVGDVEALWAHDGNLYAAGGSYGTALLREGIVRWDGASWHSLGTGLSGLEEIGYALTTYNGMLVVLGSFSRAGEVPAWTLAGWDGSSWSSIGHTVSQGLDDVPYVLGAYQGHLVAGGPFVTAGMTDARRIAVFESGVWQALGGGMSAEVYATAEYQGNLIAGGDFLLAGGTPANGSAAWDGNAWSPLGSGMDGPVYVLGIYDGDLIAGGEFTTAGGVAASCIARWNGVSWGPLGAGTNNAVWALAVYRGNLIAGGPMTTPTKYVAQWDGSAWSRLGGGVGGAVRDLEFYAGELIAGGDFSTAEGATVRHVARWNGVSWNPLGYGVTETHWDTGPFVAGLTTLLGKLYATGSFVYAGGIGSPYVVENIASWDGSSWSALDLGLDFCCTLTSGGREMIGIDDRVYVGGVFESASGVPSFHMGEWVLPATTGASEAPPIPSVTPQVTASPNPFASATVMTYTLSERTWVRLTVHDLQGRLVSVLVDRLEGPGEHTVTWSGRTATGAAAPGFYFGRLARSDQVSTVKLLKIE